MLRLTQRQINVLRRVAYGETHQEIAKALGFSINTIHNDGEAILKCLEAKNSSNAVYIGTKRGLIP